MKLLRRILVVSLLLAAIFAATGFVLTKTRRMSLFLEARDRIERGEDRQAVLRDLAARFNWEAEESGVAGRIAEEARRGAPPGGTLTVHRAGAWALLTRDGVRHLLERKGEGWREVR